MAWTVDRIDEELRPHRKALVLAAEKVVAEATPADLEKWNKTQLPLLASLAGEATCPEEIVNFLRYQSKRRGNPWPPAVARAAIDEIAPMIETLRHVADASEQERDQLAVAAWRLYATYMTRAFTYRKG